jgi:hypothetical protein
VSRAVYFAADPYAVSRAEREPTLASLEELAALLACAPDDLTSLPYGPDATLYMVAPAQRDDTPINRNASLVVQRFGGIRVAIRGDAVAFPEGTPW